MNAPPITGTAEWFDLMAQRRAAGVCTNCAKRPGIHPWGDALAVTHGMTEDRCGVCVYGAQVLHALQRLKRLPILTAKYVWALVTRS